jgi:hypothetical protein
MMASGHESPSSCGRPKYRSRSERFHTGYTDDARRIARFRKLLVPIAGSSASSLAIEYAIDIARLVTAI